MRIDDILPILFIVIFFVLPLLGKIAEAMGGGAKPKSASTDDVKEYLQKMRGQQKPKPQSAQPQYMTSMTKKPSGQRSSDHKSVDKRPKKAAAVADYLGQLLAAEEPKKERSTTREEQLAREQVGVALESKATPIVATKTGAKAPSQILKIRVLEAKRFSDLQKAIVFTEIFAKPRALNMKWLRNRT